MLGVWLADQRVETDGTLSGSGEVTPGPLPDPLPVQLLPLGSDPLQLEITQPHGLPSCSQVGIRLVEQVLCLAATLLTRVHHRLGQGAQFLLKVPGPECGV